MTQEIIGLGQLLKDIEEKSQGQEKISIQHVIEAVGLRSFAPFLILIGLILFSPLSGIPGMSTAMGVLLLLFALQLLMKRNYIWLPQWLINRSISSEKLMDALHWMEKPARFADRWIQPRMDFIVRRYGTYAIAGTCIFIALTLPIMEVIPFSASTAGLALTIFGLSLAARDGLLALIAFILTASLVLVVIVAVI
ncbi:exopolysaccharide biosynthesis protein [Microbulbifer sp. EKSA008]|uniref:exopolysaccharide biosynthesis protein n=1 Tax=unclassified Microbulbifer TaxID=2619833 RepID=UPI0024ADEE1B|nr:exopolysaccharide biosynthesis protein [Microbulbifer sp. VAAF005]WHI46489.1 exopolysaccharide biosynthesis protein [Microbulbifer sp. VAAF005]WNZ54881.1 exopolysaccharide biosynthesis protein [Microbulbifer sp. MKSA007]